MIDELIRDELAQMTDKLDKQLYSLLSSVEENKLFNIVMIPIRTTLKDSTLEMSCSVGLNFDPVHGYLFRLGNTIYLSKNGVSVAAIDLSEMGE